MAELNVKQKQLLTAHIEFEMEKVSVQKLQDTIKIETKAFLDWILSQKIGEILPEEKMEILIKEGVNKFQIEKETLKFTQKMIKMNIEVSKGESSSITSAIDKESFFTLSKDTIQLKELRTRIIKFAVNSSAYSRMISSIIFAAIKDFMVTENPIAKNPIAGSFFKMGENFLNSLPGMQGSFETKVTDFIHSNLSGRIQQSEKLINSELDSGKEVELLEEFWTFLEGISFNEIDTLFPSTEIDKLFISVPGFHEHLKKTGFAEKWILCFNKIFYKKYDKVEISKILEETGIKREVLEVEVISFLTKVLDNGKIREFYKQRISERLEDFYSSERLNSILV